MRNETAYGAILIVGSVVMLVMGITHPSALPWGDNTALTRLAAIDAFAHSLAIIGTGLVLLGLAGMSRWLGLQRVPVMAALVAFAMASVAVVVAATLDGFVIPAIALSWTEADKVAGVDLKRLVWFCVLTASAMTRIYLLLTAAAVGLWSWVIFCERLSSALPWVGLMIGITGGVRIFGGSPFVSVHEVLALALFQGIWMVLAGFMMIRKQRLAGCNSADPHRT
jgi:hypothetical protein